MLFRSRAHHLRRSLNSAISLAATATLVLLSCSAFFAAPSRSSEALAVDSLNTDKLNYRKELTALYLGDFPNSGLQPSGGTFASIFPLYVTSFARQCAAYLPNNRVEITRQECARESTPVNIYGAPVGATTCVEYRTVGTGLYADPELLAISERLQAVQGGQLLGDYLSGSADPMSSARKWTDVLLLAKDDMDRLLDINRCDSEAIKRLEDNMTRFARGGAPLRLSSGETLADVGALAPKRDPSKPADYARLIDDLILENSRGWMLNQYIQGSVGSVTVDSRDSQGRPGSIRANYRFSQLGQVTGGSVVIAFQEGLPKCLYFFDAPDTCRVASPRIANAYGQGEY